MVSGTHDDLEEPPRVPMITGLVPKRQKQETLSDALPGAVPAFVKSFHSTQTDKTADIHMKNLQQLHFLQQLMEDRIISEQEFLEPKNIILETSRNLD